MLLELITTNRDLIIARTREKVANRTAARAMGGDIHVRDVPGIGCVLTVDLRRSILE